MRKSILLLLLLTSLTLMLPSCSHYEQEKDEFHIVATIFPLYDWSQSILENAEGVRLTLLLDTGTDVHSYQPSARDIIDIQNADLFLYVGGESDQWVDEVLRQASATSNRLALLPLMEVHTEEHLHITEDHHHTTDSYDEHIWLSLSNAADAVREITHALTMLLPDQAELLESNTNRYLSSLTALEESYRGVIASASCRSILVADRFPFLYLAEEWDLTYYAAFPGCSAETEASFETVAYLADILAREQLPAVLTTESSDGTLAKTIIQTSGVHADVLALDSMQSVTAQKIESGYHYLSVMEKNLAVLSQALGSPS